MGRATFQSLIYGGFDEYLLKVAAKVHYLPAWAGVVLPTNPGANQNEVSLKPFRTIDHKVL